MSGSKVANTYTRAETVIVAATDTKRVINPQNTLEGPKSSAHKEIYAESNAILVLLAKKG
jgi:hypothetical protein